MKVWGSTVYGLDSKGLIREGYRGIVDTVLRFEEVYDVCRNTLGRWWKERQVGRVHSREICSERVNTH